jgi:N-acetylglucosamine-6-phosphate deacetylase
LVTDKIARIALGSGVTLTEDVTDSSVETTDSSIPGVFDVQVNGAGLYDLNSPNVTASDVVALVQLEWKVGTTQFCPTIVTGPKDRMLHSLEVVAKARSDDPLLAYTMPYIHVEGPHLSTLDGPRGAHNLSFIRPPDLREFAEWQTVAGGAIKIVTIAPELPGALEYIGALAGMGVVVSLGHTAATPEQIHLAVSTGARCATHLGNGCEAVLPRHPNRIWAQLADKRLRATFIADGQHLDDDTLLAMVQAKGLHRSILISDSIATGESQLDGLKRPARLELTGTPYLVGGASPLLPCLIGLVGRGTLTWAQVARLASVNPRALLGRGRRGTLGIPRASDISIVDVGGTRPEVKGVVVNGVHVVA